MWEILSVPFQLLIHTYKHRTEVTDASVGERTTKWSVARWDGTGRGFVIWGGVCLAFNDVDVYLDDDVYVDADDDDDDNNYFGFSGHPLSHYNVKK